MLTHYASPGSIANEIRLFGGTITGGAESFGDIDIADELGWARKRWKPRPERGS
jgi:hypothetical protein